MALSVCLSVRLYVCSFVCRQRIVVGHWLTGARASADGDARPTGQWISGVFPPVKPPPVKFTLQWRGLNFVGSIKVPYFGA